MKKLKTCLIWYRIFLHRFVRKRMYLLLLLFLPVSAGILQLVSAGDSSVMNVLLIRETSAFADCTDPDSNLSFEDFALRLQDRAGIVHYEISEDPTAAMDSVRSGDASCILFIPADISDAIQEYLSGDCDSIFRVWTLKDNVACRLCREQIYAAVYPELSSAFTADYIYSKSGDTDASAFTDRTYALYTGRPSFFEYVYEDKSSISADAAVLTAPLRGLLACFLFLTGLSLALFYLQDRQNGCFLSLSGKRNTFTAFLYILAGLTPAAVIMYLSLYCSGSFTHWPRELVLLTLYVLSTAAFSAFCASAFRDVSAFGAAVPVLVILSLILCPVFISVSFFSVPGSLLPGYHYLNALHSLTAFRALLLFCPCCLALSRIFEKLSRHD